MQQKEPSMQDLIQMANSPAGQQLLQMLQAQNSQALHEAASSAAAGNMKQAKNILQQLLKNPELKQLLEQMGGGHE